MHSKYRRTGVAMGVMMALGGVATPATADIVYMSWSGLFTMLNQSGTALMNVSYPYYADPTWGYGRRTPISGTMTLDTATGAGSATIAPFDLLNNATDPSVVFSGISLQAIGDAAGGPGTLVLGNMLFSWGGNYGIPVSIVWDAAGLFAALGDGTYVTESISGVGATPASDGINKGAYPIGPAPMVTTTWNTTATCVRNAYGDCLGVNPSGALPLVFDVLGVGGSPMIDGPFLGYNINLDITSIHIESGPVCSNGLCPPVPIPAAIWLFGSGLLGLAGITLRHRR